MSLRHQSQHTRLGKSTLNWILECVWIWLECTRYFARKLCWNTNHTPTFCPCVHGEDDSRLSTQVLESKTDQLSLRMVASYKLSLQFWESCTTMNVWWRLGFVQKLLLEHHVIKAILTSKIGNNTNGQVPCTIKALGLVVLTSRKSRSDTARYWRPMSKMRQQINMEK